MQIVKLKFSELQPNTGQIPGLPINPRQWTKSDVDKIAASLKETPELFEARPLLVIPHDGKFVILGGNLRYEGARVNKMKEVPAIIFPEDTPVDKMKEVVIKDNGSFGAWDTDYLANEWDDLPLTDWGVPVWETEEEKNLNGISDEVREDEFDEDVETRCQPGDIWELGNHRLMCGDSTDAASVALLMNGEKADIAFTSPPYGVGLDYNEYKDSFENTKSLVEKVFPLMAEYTEDYLVLNWSDIMAGKEINKTEHPSMFSWVPVYLSLLQNLGWYLWAERIWKKPHARCAGVWSASSNRPVNDWEFIFSFVNKRPSYNERANDSHFGIIDSSEDSQSDTLSKHPGAFPVFVPSRVILIHSKEGASVLDLFGGTGTTLIAAEQLGRKCYMMELDPHYCDIILARWEKLTGQTATKL